MPTPCPVTPGQPVAAAHLKHLVLQFDFLVPFLLWMQMDVVQVPVGGRGIHKSYLTLLPPLGLTLSEPGTHNTGRTTPNAQTPWVKLRLTWQWYPLPASPGPGLC